MIDRFQSPGQTFLLSMISTRLSRYFSTKLTVQINILGLVLPYDQQSPIAWPNFLIINDINQCRQYIRSVHQYINMDWFYHMINRVQLTVQTDDSRLSWLPGAIFNSKSISIVLSNVSLIQSYQDIGNPQQQINTIVLSNVCLIQSIPRLGQSSIANLLLQCCPIQCVLN